LYQIQVVRHDRFYDEKLAIQERRWSIEAPRGNIYDRRGNPLALNLKLYSVAADPGLIDAPAELAGQLADLLRMDEQSLNAKLCVGEGVRYVPLQDWVDGPTAEAAGSLGCPGLIVNTHWKRAYPHAGRAASLLGFIGRDGTALGGIEKEFDAKLAGADGEMVVVLDGRLPRSRAVIPQRTGVRQPMVPGSSVVLTIDLDIQTIAEEELAKAVENARAVGGTAIVMDPDTGEVLALATQPSFDPNEFWLYPRETWVNQAVTSPYEPGSTFKVITACAAIEEDVMSRGETYECEGTRLIGRQRINCALHGGKRAHDTLDLDGMFVHSCNTGMATVSTALGEDRMHRWLKRFGFGEPTGIELAGESRGILSSPDRWSQMRLANLGFGQGIGVTPVQLLAAYCAVANGGRLVRPRLVMAVTHPDGRTERPTHPEPERILSTATCDRMRELMTRVVEEGTGGAARIPGRLVAGKTGTAQKPTPEAGFRSGKYIASFAGFAPADDPRLAVLVIVDEPRNGHYGGVLAAPAFRAICQRALTHLRVPPTRPEAGINLAMAEADR
jgi:stage V sporulation protein D (sporulation-specific penicillin-binding protein)